MNQELVSLDLLPHQPAILGQFFRPLWVGKSHDLAGLRSPGGLSNFVTCSCFLSGRLQFCGWPFFQAMNLRHRAVPSDNLFLARERFRAAARWTGIVLIFPRCSPDQRHPVHAQQLKPGANRLGHRARSSNPSLFVVIYRDRRRNLLDACHEASLGRGSRDLRPRAPIVTFSLRALRVGWFLAGYPC